MLRKSTGLWLLLFAMVLIGSLIVGGWQVAQSVMLSRSVSEGRTIADMVEGVGRWASKYGGMHARTEGLGAPIPGSYLTRSTYAVTTTELGLLQGVKADQGLEQRQAMERLENYHWKNPALIQREIADVLAESGSRSFYRMTARTVLNQNNAPNPFELEALNNIQQAFAKLSADDASKLLQRGGVASLQSDTAGPNEYWRVEKGQLHYARAVIAQGSCLKCHDTPERAPEFLKTNAQFNGGGGFGYKVGQPVGVISVKVPMPPVSQVVEQGVSKGVTAAMLMALFSAIGVLVLGARVLFSPSTSAGQA